MLRKQPIEELKELINNLKEFNPLCFPEIIVSEGCLRFASYSDDETSLNLLENI